MKKSRDGIGNIKKYILSYLQRDFCAQTMISKSKDDWWKIFYVVVSKIENWWPTAVAPEISRFSLAYDVQNSTGKFVESKFIEINIFDSIDVIFSDIWLQQQLLMWDRNLSHSMNEHVMCVIYHCYILLMHNKWIAEW